MLHRHTRRALLPVGIAVCATLVAAPSPAAAKKTIDGEYLVKFDAGTTAEQRDAAVAKKGGRITGVIDGIDVYRVTVAADKQRKSPPTDAEAEAKARDIEQEPDVAFAEPDQVMTASYVPNDPGYSQQYAWGRIGAPAAWDVTRGSAATKIAVIDTGYVATHPDLDAKDLPGYDWVDDDSTPQDGHGHGTHVAGTAAAETGNATGGAGTCPNCSVLPLRVLNNSGNGSLADVASAITYAADQDAQVINMSLGGPGSTTLQNAVNYAWNAGTFLACAAGNDNTSSTSSAYPGAYPNCFAVASTTSSDARSSFSNYGTWVEVAAPGSNIYSTWLGTGYHTISGTSMASPHVAGLAGLLSSQGLTNQQIKDRICSTAAKISGTGSFWTCGRIDAAAAVGGTTPTPTPTPTATPPTGGTIVNGGFESGTSPWVQSSSGGYQIVTTTRPRTGSYSAYEGGYNNATESIRQTVTVPANGTLRYWWYMTTSESGSTVYDRLAVRVLSTGGSVLATPRTWSNASGAGVWRQDSLSLAAYAGQTVQIEFRTTTDSSLQSSFFVDDVTL